MDQKNDGKRYAALLAGFVVWVLAALPVAAGPEVEDLYWDRLDRIIQSSSLRENWDVVSQSQAHRRLKCSTCESEVMMTISANVVPQEITDRFTVRQAIKAYRTTRCRELVQSGEGRCVRSGIALIEGDLVEHEEILIYGGMVIWGHTTWPKDNRIPDALNGRLPEYPRNQLMFNLMKSLTPLH